MRITLFILLFYFFLNPLHSQEFVTGLVKNKTLEDASKVNRFALKRAYSLNDTLQLPFFDDFASTTIYPDQRLWTDSFAFINSQFPVNPPTVGVATMDALNQNGAIYSNASYSSFPADKLSSQYINLNY